MARGFKTGGRQAGTPNRTTVARELRTAHGLQAAHDTGLLPLDVLLARMRDEPLPNGQKVTDQQFDAAIAAAPYLHSRLAATTLRGDRDAPLVQAVIDTRRSLADLIAEAAAKVVHLADL